jgi:branched-chain amino acid transport system substrate-binding protein
MVRRTPLASVLALAAVMTLAAMPAGAQTKIGAAGPVTGAYANIGKQMSDGVTMAVADINAKGGVLGKKLDLRIADDACDPKQAVSVANQLASDGAVFVAGHFCSSSSIPASKVYTEEGVLMISPASTNPKFTDEGSWNTFRSIGRDDQQGKVAGHLLASRFKDVKVAILHDNTTYGKGIADQTKKQMNAEGKAEDLYQAYVPGERDYAALVSRLKQAGIGAVYIGGYHAETGLILRQAKEQGLKATFIGPDSLVTKELWQIAGDAAEGVMMTFPSDPRSRPSAAAVVAQFKAKGIDPEGFTLYTYAAVQEFAEAAAKAGTTDPKKVAAELKSGGPWQTVLGPISFDEKGDVTDADYVFYVWHDGSYAQM